MSEFVFVNWALILITSIVLIMTIWSDRSLLIKPSIMAILFFHVMCQWGAVIEAEEIQSFLPSPWIFVLLTHGFPLFGLVLSLITGRRTARALWNRVKIDKQPNLSLKKKAIVILALFYILYILFYLYHIPLSSTGLYAILFSPGESAQARELSVKLSDNAFLRYGHSIVMAVFAPILSVLLAQLLFGQIRRRAWISALPSLLGIGLILLTVSISGARAYAAYIVLAVLFAIFLRRGFPFNPVYVISGMILVLAGPTILSLLREGQAVTVEYFIDYLTGAILDRVVILPMQMGLWYVHHAQVNGFLGIQAIPKLANLIGIESLNVPNYIALMYSNETLESITAPAAYVYSYYSYFGLVAFIPSLIALWLLDLSLTVYRNLSDNLLIPCIACISITTNLFSNAEWTIVLFSQGFILILIVSWMVDRMVGTPCDEHPASGPLKPTSPIEESSSPAYKMLLPASLRPGAVREGSSR